MVKFSLRILSFNVRNFLQELKANVDLACNTAEEFIKFFYESLDKKRQVNFLFIYHLYFFFFFI